VAYIHFTYYRGVRQNVVNYELPQKDDNDKINGRCETSAGLPGWATFGLFCFRLAVKG
jgi:hypothetical protein